MEGEGYRRPRLCRLCECPVVDGGVLLQKQRLEKLSRWWKAHWDTDLQLDKKHCVVCHFCIWDLRFADQHSEEKEPAGQTWWPKYKRINHFCQKVTSNLYFKYYLDESMKPCSVKIAPLENEDKLLKECSQRGFGHRCLYCPRSYVTRQILLKHAKTVHPDQIVYCNNSNNCGKLFHTNKEKAKHVEKEHQDKRDFPKCIYCGNVSTNKDNFRYHVQKYHKSQIIRCKLQRCRNYFKSKAERDKHFDKFHNCGTYFCCTFCNRCFKSRGMRNYHVRKYHKEAFKCKAYKLCTEYFKTEEDMQKHIQEKHSKNDKCIYCGEFVPKISSHIKWYHKDVALRCEYFSRGCATWFKTEEERQKHYKEKHESGKNMLVCPFCNKRFLRNYNQGIQTHLKFSHKNQRAFKCKYTASCLNYFRNEEDRLQHIKEVHEIHDEKFRCVYCDKLFPKTENLNRHIKKWHKDVAINCNVNRKCGIYFKTAEDKDKHIREVHQAEKIRKPLPCLYCGQILAGKDTLGTHMKNKHAKTAIRCHQHLCFSFFKSQDELEKHFSLFPKHRRTCKKDDQKFNCALCLKSFLQKSTLVKHTMNQHNNTDKKMQKMCPHYKKAIYSKYCHIQSDFCKVCNQKFQCLGLLRSHRMKCKPVFHCLICSESFISDIQLNYHCKLKHTVPIFKWKGLQFKSRGFKCEDCFFYFSSKTSHRLHKTRVHETSEVTCDTCKKQFSNTFYLQTHILRIHLGMKKFFFCPLCNRKFDSENAMRKHVQNKCDLILVECQICGKLVKSKAMNYHIRKNH